MRQAGQRLVEIHGQHDDRALVEPDAHRQLLDAFGGLGGGGRGARPALPRLAGPGEGLARPSRQGGSGGPRGGFSARLGGGTGSARAGRRGGGGTRREAGGDDEGREDRHRHRGSGLDPLRQCVAGPRHQLAAAPAGAQGGRGPRACSTTRSPRSTRRSMRWRKRRWRSRRRCATPSSIRASWNTTEERLFALRAASRKYAVPVSRASGACRPDDRGIWPISMPASRGSASSRGPSARRVKPTTRLRARSRRSAITPPRCFARR